jgi:basic amino acid/polyamine antiporter, APA family
VTTAPRRTLGTRQAVLLGITAIIGGAPIVLAGAAFAAAGPSVLVAVALVATLAALGALALAELGARFPRSGGPYMFTQRVLGLESAFAVGWLLLFGSLAAAAVFALGFASFGLAMLRAAVEAGGATLAAADDPAARVGLAVAAIAAYGARGWRRLRRPPALLTLAKVVGMAGIGAVGLVALGLRPSAIDGVSGTFFTGGPVGVAQAMGMMVIAYQGFVLLSAAAGELREPARTLPRASLVTIAVATVLYLPLFFVTATVGRPDGMGLIDFAVATDATMVAVGAERYFGAAGFWWVALTAVLATLTALEAQLQGASRLARAMAHDGTLPRWLARSGAGGVPRRAVLTATGFAALLVLILPEVRTAGVAAGVIFMAVLALAHLLAVLVRRRSAPDRIPYRAPWAPASLWIGGLAALTVSLVNAATVPPAGVTVLAWLLLGSLVYIAALKTQARALDAGLEGADPDVVALRGRRPLVLTPIANPINAEALMSVAHALAPPRVGRVTTLHVMVAGPGAGRPGATPDASRGTTASVDDGVLLDTAQRVLASSLAAALALGLSPQALTTLADDPWDEIARVARSLDCEGLLLGLSDLGDAHTLARLDELLARVRSDVVVLRAPPGWHLERCRRVVVPFAGRSDQERLRARVLSSLARVADPEVEIVRLLPQAADEDACRRAQRHLERLVEGRDLGRVRCVAEATGDAAAALVRRAAAADLLVLGLPRFDADRHALGAFATRVATATPASCAVMLIHARA